MAAKGDPETTETMQTKLANYKAQQRQALPKPGAASWCQPMTTKVGPTKIGSCLTDCIYLEKDSKTGSVCYTDKASLAELTFSSQHMYPRLDWGSFSTCEALIMQVDAGDGSTSSSAIPQNATTSYQVGYRAGQVPNYDNYDGGQAHQGGVHYVPPINLSDFVVPRSVICGAEYGEECARDGSDCRVGLPLAYVFPVISALFQDPGVEFIGKSSVVFTHEYVWLDAGWGGWGQPGEFSYLAGDTFHSLDSKEQMHVILDGKSSMGTALLSFEVEEKMPGTPGHSAEVWRVKARLGTFTHVKKGAWSDKPSPDYFGLKKTRMTIDGLEACPEDALSYSAVTSLRRTSKLQSEGDKDDHVIVETAVPVVDSCVQGNSGKALQETDDV